MTGTSNTLTRDRHRKGSGQMTKTVVMRMEPALREQAGIKADAMGRSFSGHVRHLLRQDLNY